MNYFQDIDIFHSISLEDQQNLSDFCQLQVLQAGENLFLEGDEPRALYVVKQGKLLVQKNKQGIIKPIARLGFGDIVGEMAFFGDPPLRNASVSAIEETHLVTLLHFSLTQILEKYPLLHTKLKQIIEKRTQENTVS